MQFIGTSFEDYVLDQFIKVQLLFDESYRYVKVAEIKEIPGSPIVENVTKSLFHKGNTLMKHLIEILNELSNFNRFKLHDEFKKNIIKFYSLHKLEFKNLTPDSVVSGFQSYLTNEKKLTTQNELYYIQLTQLIDVMLLCKSSNGEKSHLLGIRNDLLSCSYLQLPNITDEKLGLAICQSFEIPKDVLQLKINQLKQTLSKNDVVAFFKSNLTLSNRYNEADFENVEYYQNWLLKSKNLENDMITFFADPLDKGSSKITSILPNQLNDAVSLLIAISLNSTSSFFHGLIRCMQIWQINPFVIQFQFIEIASTMNNDTDSKIDPELVEKAFNLSYLAMPFQIQFLEWPLGEKKNFLSMSLRIYNESIDSIKPFFGMFFQDQKSFTTVLSFLKLLKLNLKNVKTEIKNNLVTVINQRLNSHRSTSKLIESKLDLNSMVKFLTLVSRDVNLLYNWKINNKDLNLSFQIFEIGSKILMSPTLEIIKHYISELRSSNFNLMTNKDNKSNFGSFIDLVNNLKSRTNFKYDFQNDIFNDFFKIVESWNMEMINKTKVIIANDNLNRLEGCSYSSSIQNLILLFDGYIKLLESFKWQDEFQSSELNIVLYKNIINSVKYYHSSMIAKMNKLNKLKDLDDNKNIDSFVCLNNIYKLFDFLQRLEKNENVLKVSKYLVTNGKNRKALTKSTNKYVSVFIKNAENIEDFRGNPLSLKVKLSGVVNDETRVILKDYNPDWLEEFNVIVTRNGGSNESNLKIELVDVDSNSIYKAVNYNVNLNSENLFKHQIEKILLKPKSGSLNINVNVEFEKNDPLFYIVNCKNGIENSIKRSLNFLIEKYLLDFKEIFTLAYLQKSLVDNPIRSENNYTKLQDPLIDTMIGNFKIKIIPQIYDNLETKLFDRLIVELWIKILSIAENLLLPRISIINYSINSKLNKKASTGMPSSPSGGGDNRASSSNISHAINQTTREELIRVVEWCYKFRSMLDLPDMILQDDSLNKPFEEFNQIKQLFHQSIKELRKNYYNSWNFLNRNMLNRLSKGVKYDRVRWACASKDKEYILRVLLAKGELKFVKSVLEMEQRFEKTVKTEIEVIYLQQFL